MNPELKALLSAAVEAGYRWALATDPTIEEYQMSLSAFFADYLTHDDERFLVPEPSEEREEELTWETIDISVFETPLTGPNYWEDIRSNINVPTRLTLRVMVFACRVMALWDEGLQHHLTPDLTQFLVHTARINLFLANHPGPDDPFTPEERLAIHIVTTTMHRHIVRV